MNRESADTMGKIQVEPLGEFHREAVMRIFNHYVTQETAAFADAELPETFYPQILERVKGYPAYAVVDRQAGEVVGFCFLSAYKPIPTFRETATITYFIAPSHLGKGIGRMCLARLEEAAVKQGIRHLLAEISSENEQSMSFHAGQGFVHAGRLKNVGFKLGRAFDIVYMQKEL